MALTDLWGVAGRTQSRLVELGIKTPLQLRDADPRFVRERFNVIMQRMVLELRGTPCMNLEALAPDRKSVMASRSFGRPVTTFQELREAVSTYVARAAEKMRRQHLATAHLIVFVNTNQFKTEDAQYHATKAVRLPVATADTGRLLKAAQTALAAVWKPDYSYKKAGVVLLDLKPASRVQGDLWRSPDTPRAIELMRAVDGLNRRYGRDAIVYSSAGKRKAWRLRSEFMSPRYTTDWGELLRV